MVGGVGFFIGFRCFFKIYLVLIDVIWDCMYLVFLSNNDDDVFIYINRYFYNGFWVMMFVFMRI